MLDIGYLKYVQGLKDFILRGLSVKNTDYNLEGLHVIFCYLSNTNFLILVYLPAVS